MGLFEPIVLFSAVVGVVTLDGAPMADVEVERRYRWSWTDAEGSEVVRTDEQGKFAFPVITGSSFTARWFPHEPVVTQVIVVHHEGEEFEAWRYTKHNYHPNGELHRSLDFICDLAMEAEFRGEYYGICELS